MLVRIFFSYRGDPEYNSKEIADFLIKDLYNKIQVKWLYCIYNYKDETKENDRQRRDDEDAVSIANFFVLIINDDHFENRNTTNEYVLFHNNKVTYKLKYEIPRDVRFYTAYTEALNKISCERELMNSSKSEKFSLENLEKYESISRPSAWNKISDDLYRHIIDFTLFIQKELVYSHTYVECIEYQNDEKTFLDRSYLKEYSALFSKEYSNKNSNNNKYEDVIFCPRLIHFYHTLFFPNQAEIKKQKNYFEKYAKVVQEIYYNYAPTLILLIPTHFKIKDLGDSIIGKRLSEFIRAASYKKYIIYLGNDQDTDKQLSKMFEEKNRAEATNINYSKHFSNEEMQNLNLEEYQKKALEKIINFLNRKND